MSSSTKNKSTLKKRKPTETSNRIRVSLLTGGKDKPYVLGLTSGLAGSNVEVEFVGNDEMQHSDIFKHANAKYFNLRGDQTPNASALKKITRVLVYYIKLLRYVSQTGCLLFHIQWLNKFTHLDRTLLNLYYKLNGKTLVYTAHNVNMAERDANESSLNRFTLRYMYRIVDHIIVHTEKMKTQLSKDFDVPQTKISVIPFGINNTVPISSLSRQEARAKLDIEKNHKVLLFFGNIAPYKGLEYAIFSLPLIRNKYSEITLIIAGRIKNCPTYWQKLETLIDDNGIADHIDRKIEFIPDEEIECFFKAADVLVLPYKFIYQSGLIPGIRKYPKSKALEVGQYLLYI